MVHSLNVSLCLWRFNLLFHKVLVQPFLIRLVWLAATKKHLTPHPMSVDFFNVKYFTQLCTAKVFWNEFLLFFSRVNFFCVHLLKSSIQRYFAISWWIVVCSKMEIKPKFPAHSNMPCDAMGSPQFQICFYFISVCPNILMNNWGLFLWMFYSLASLPFSSLKHYI